MKNFKFCLLAIGIAGLLNSPVWAADPAAITGRWIEKFPNGKGMITEFTLSTISAYPVDEMGKPVGTIQKMPVTYKDLGQAIIEVVFSGGGGIMVFVKNPTEITLDFPGVGAHHLTKVQP